MKLPGNFLSTLLWNFVLSSEWVIKTFWKLEGVQTHWAVSKFQPAMALRVLNDWPHIDSGYLCQPISACLCITFWFPSYYAFTTNLIWDFSPHWGTIHIVRMQEVGMREEAYVYVHTQYYCTNAPSCSKVSIVVSSRSFQFPACWHHECNWI